MTDRNPPARDASPEGRNRRIPPLVWIILAVVVAWLIGIAVWRQGVDRTPHGGTMPRASQPTSYMPATPPQGSAPATPAGTANGPQEPAGGAAPR